MIPQSQDVRLFLSFSEWRGSERSGKTVIRQTYDETENDKNERIDRVELMRTFVRIVEAGSLSAAAKQIGTTQATVSRRLQSLETLLGVKLLMRTTHAMKLTDDGERGYQHAKKIIDAWLALEDGLNVTEDEPVGRCESAHRMRSGNNNYLSRFCSFFRAIPSWQ